MIWQVVLGNLITITLVPLAIGFIAFIIGLFD